MTSDEKRIMEKDFDLLYKQYKDSIFNFCMARLKCDIELSEECTQETFIILFKRMKKGEAFENPRAFLYKAANNFIMQARDKKSKAIEVDASLDDIAPFVADNSEDIDSKVNYMVLTELLNSTLDEEEAEIFKLRFVNDMKIDEIAEELNINPSTCATKIFRLRSKVKLLLKDYYGYSAEN